MDNGADAFYRAAITTAVVAGTALIAGFSSTTAIATCAIALVGATVVGCLRG